MPILEIPLTPELAELLDSLFEMAHDSAMEMKKEDDKQYEGWYCINMAPEKCPGCGELMVYLEPPQLHLIIVWEDKEDDALQECVRIMKEANRDPEIRQYHPMFGSCITWDDCAQMYDLAF